MKSNRNIVHRFKRQSENELILKRPNIPTEFISNLSTNPGQFEKFKSKPSFLTKVS